MAAAKCIISFDIPSVKDILVHRRTGILVKGRDNDQFIREIIQLASDDSTRMQIGSEAQGVVSSKYAIKDNIRSLEDIYIRILRTVT